MTTAITSACRDEDGENSCWTTFPLTAASGTHVGSVALPQVVGEVVLDLAHKLLRVLGVEAQNLTQPLQADVLQVAVRQRLHVGVGLNHLLFGQRVRTNQISFTWGGGAEKGGCQKGLTEGRGGRRLKESSKLQKMQQPSGGGVMDIMWIQANNQI